MYTSILKLVCIHNDLLLVLTNHVAIFKEVKYKDGHMIGQNR